VSSDREGWFDSSLNYAAWKLVDLAPIP
jgi:hypothetical protein